MDRTPFPKLKRRLVAILRGLEPHNAVATAQAVFDVEEALKPGTPAIKPHGKNYFVYEGHHCRRIRFGDVDKAFAQADHIIEHRYQSAPIEHAPTETTGCIVKPEGNGRFTIYSNTQACYFTLDNAALIVGLPFNKLRVIGGTVGGAEGRAHPGASAGHRRRLDTGAAAPRRGRRARPAPWVCESGLVCRRHRTRRYRTGRDRRARRLEERAGGLLPAA